jgi:competence protein ComGC
MKKSSSAFSLIEISLVVLIVSLIAAGILTTTNIIKKSRLQTAQILTKNSPVNNISNLVAWFETSLDSSFVGNEKSDGSAISTWYDNNPDAASKNNATQSTSANKPTFTANVFNSGIPAIRFDGSDDYLVFDGSSLINSSYTIFVVEQRRSGKDGNYFISGSDRSTNQNLILGYRSNLVATHAHFGNDMNYLGIETYSSPISRIHTYSLNLAASQSNSGKRYWINGSGASAKSVTNTSQTGPITSYAGASFGRSSTSYYFDGDLAEVIIFNRNLSNAERLSVETYLGQKYNIKVTTS